MKNANEGELRLSLFDHLAELRRRLTKAVIAVLILGLLSLAFAEELFYYLVYPILQALPEGERALVQTSAIEEINTFIKVGLYAGVFLSAPVVLHQIWGFIAPGLYAHERRMAVPFVAAGTGCFVAGVAFCYFVVLPPAFEFLLKPEELRGRVVELHLARGSVEDAGRLIRAGDLANATRLLDEADRHLESLPSAGTDGSRAILDRIEGLAPAIDAADRAVASGRKGAEALSSAILATNEARAFALRGDDRRAASAIEKAERELREAYALGLGGAEGARVQRLLEHHAGSVARLAAAQEQLGRDDWTRPMLSMREQLNLVIVLLLAFGVIFEIPVLFALLAALGVIDGSELARYRRYALVANVFIAAVLTPTGDPFNLAMMAVPMVLCYEIGVIAARLISRRRRSREAEMVAA